MKNNFLSEQEREALKKMKEEARKACKQVRIEAEQHTALKMLAAVEGIPLEEVTKKIIAKGLGR